MPTPQERSDALALINVTNRDRLAVQSARLDKIETRGTLLLGFSVAAVQFLITKHNGAQPAWITLAFVTYAASFVSGVFLVGPYRGTITPPDPTSLYEKYRGKTPDEINDAVAYALAGAFFVNAQQVTLKKRLWSITLVLLIGAIVFSGLALR